MSGRARRSRTVVWCTAVHIGAEAVIANHATVLDGAVIGARSLIAAHSLVVGGTKIPDEVLVTGAPAKVRGPIAGTGAEMWVNTNRRCVSGPGPALPDRFGGIHVILR